MKIHEIAADIDDQGQIDTALDNLKGAVFVGDIIRFYDLDSDRMISWAIDEIDGGTIKLRFLFCNFMTYREFLASQIKKGLKD